MNADPAISRKLVYTLLITVAAAGVAGRIIATERVLEPSLHKAQPKDDKGRVWPEKRPRPVPMFSSNDVSRWATVRALVDEGTFVIGRRDRNNVVISAATAVGAWHGLDTAVLVQAGFFVRSKKSDSGIIFEPGWESVDKVLHPGKLEFFSSKPPLLSIFIAGLYWLLQQLTGWTLATHPFAVVRTILLLVNGGLFVIYLVVLSRIIERYGRTDWGRYFTLAAACFATLVTPFENTLNNHTIATFTTVFVLYPALRILEHIRAAPDEPMSLNAYFAMAGLFAAFTACMELPATALAVGLGGILLWLAPWRTLLVFVPAAVVPVAAFFLTNYIAVGQWRPAYSEFGGPWYEYEGSHWRRPNPGEVRPGIDWAWTQESRATYALHFFIGHHGLFSLTPLWLLAIWGMSRVSVSDLGRWIRRERSPPHKSPEQSVHNLILGLTIAVSVAVVGFYLFRSDNYGGWTSGLRWLMWLSPLWLFALLPVADYLAERRWGRALGLVLLALSIVAVSFPAWNPWRHPWIYRFLEDSGWWSGY